MGLLKESKTLSWPETQSLAVSVKKRGAEHFAAVYNQADTKKTTGFLWGEELEQNIVGRVDGHYALIVGADLLLESLGDSHGNHLYNIEYSRYMLESTPKTPYEPRFKNLGRVEALMEERRKEVQEKIGKCFGPDAFLLFLPCFPLLGTPLAFGTGGMGKEEWVSAWKQEFERTPMNEPPSSIPTVKEEGHGLEICKKRASKPSFRVTRSSHFPDFGITQHRRFYDFSYNIRERRGRPLHMSIESAKIEKAVSSDQKDQTQKHLPNPNKEEKKSLEIFPNPDKDPVVIDSMGQGMGCCCLQITMQSESLAEARLLYDNIGAICPLLLFLSMATPIVSEILTDTSNRWEIIGASVDCRKEDEKHIRKSRFSSIDLYTSCLPDDLDKIYNDINPYTDTETLRLLREKGVDDALSRHVASLFVRDPILCYDQTTAQEDFENIQSSNWRSMRLKPPKFATESGWLVEVRPMDIQPTSFENTAFSIFVVLFSRMVLSLNTTFYLPISKVDVNFSRTNIPIRMPQNIQDWLEFEKEQKFWYRENIFDMGPPIIKEGTIQEIFLGTDKYCGILVAIERYLKEYSEQDRKEVQKYLDFVRDRVSGKKMSVATYLRKYVSEHPLYEGDSRVSQHICDDIVAKMRDITQNNTPEYLNR